MHINLLPLLGIQQSRVICMFLKPEYFTALFCLNGCRLHWLCIKHPLKYLFVTITLSLYHKDSFRALKARSLNNIVLFILIYKNMLTCFFLLPRNMRETEAIRMVNVFETTKLRWLCLRALCCASRYIRICKSRLMCNVNQFLHLYLLYKLLFILSLNATRMN